MKTTKKSKKSLPQVHILGDLQDVKNLVSAVNKKRTIVLFHDGELDSFYLEFEGEISEIRQNDISRLEKDYKLIIFSFFPSRKKVEPLMENEPKVKEEEKPAIDAPLKEKKKKKTVKTAKKEKASKKEQLEKKEKHKK
ncbi:MAG: hypothetical protein WCK34_06570 [Bacteroidota bacterium]